MESLPEQKTHPLFPGRKLLLVVFGFMLTCSLLLFAVSTEVPERLHVAILTIALGSYVFSFSMAWGSIPWVLCGEVFTTENQGRAVSMVTAVNWSFNFITVFSWPALNTMFHSSTIFYGYSGLMFAGTIFVTVFLPETRGLTFNQIADLFSPEGPPRYVSVVHRLPPASETSQQGSNFFANAGAF
eukprot:sb/3471441/